MKTVFGLETELKKVTVVDEYSYYAENENTARGVFGNDVIIYTKYDNIFLVKEYSYITDDYVDICYVFNKDYCVEGCGYKYYAVLKEEYLRITINLVNDSACYNSFIEGCINYNFFGSDKGEILHLLENKYLNGFNIDFSMFNEWISYPKELS